MPAEDNKLAGDTPAAPPDLLAIGERLTEARQLLYVALMATVAISDRDQGNALDRLLGRVLDVLTDVEGAVDALRLDERPA